MRTPTLMVVFAMTTTLLWGQLLPLSFLSKPKERGFDVDIQAQQNFMADLYQIQTLVNTYHRDWTGLIFYNMDFNPEAGIHSFVAALSRKLDDRVALLGGYGLRRMTNPESSTTVHSMTLGVNLTFPRIWWQMRIDHLSIQTSKAFNTPSLRSEFTLLPKASYQTHFVFLWPLMQVPQWQLVGSWRLDNQWTVAIIAGGMTFQLGLCVEYNITSHSRVRLSNQHNLVLGSSPSVGFHYDHSTPKHLK